MKSESAAAARSVSRSAHRASNLAFVKYSMCGNTFIIVNEAVTPLANDSERAAFASWALDGRFGIGGSDNVLYLHEPPRQTPKADVALRVFEHDGSETLSCGNGLLSVAALLNDVDARDHWMILTELPSGTPRPVRVGRGQGVRETRVDFGRPRAVPESLFTGGERRYPSAIQPVEGLRLRLPGLGTGTSPEEIVLSGFLVFTGEPHLVLLAGSGLPDLLTHRIFPENATDGTARSRETAAAAEADRLVHCIGRSTTRTYRHLFPQGVHVNFARVPDAPGVIEYRTYERAIDRETLACGSGAVATVAVARWLGLISDRHVTLWPHRCRRYECRATLGVCETETGFVLSGTPRLVYSGVVARGASA